MSTYVARNTVVKVSVGPASGPRVAHILRAGDIVPEGVESDLLERLAERGLIEKLPEPDADGADKPKGTRSRARGKGAQEAAGSADSTGGDGSQDAAGGSQDGPDGNGGTPPQQ